LERKRILFDLVSQAFCDLWNLWFFHLSRVIRWGKLSDLAPFASRMANTVC
jgi:hypothetical protein